MKTYTAIGLMSGTSLDGVDVACIETNGETFIRVLAQHYLPYPNEFRKKLAILVQKAHQAHGDISTITRLLAQDHHNFQQILEALTDYHIQATQELIQQLTTTHHSVHMVGFHGQTIYHDPNAGISLQMGLPERLAQKLSLPVIYDFRSNDLAHGGQGAPIAPIYHLARCYQEGIPHAIVINCGGISNITVVQPKDPEHLLSFDTGPGNNLLDRYIFSRTQGALYFDQDGALSLKGQCNAATLNQLIQTHESYLLAPPPKSLDISDLKLVKELDQLSLEDACCTLATFTSYCIAEGLQRFSKAIPNLWILAGGGAHHPTIVTELRAHATRNQAQLFLAHEMGWDDGGLEAELIAYAAVRHYCNLPLTYPNTTGVSSPQIGGKRCLPLEKNCKMV